MTKEQMIERYGLEYYEQHKARNNMRNKKRYHVDSNYRESKKVQLNFRYRNDSEVQKYIKETNKAYKKARYVKDGRIDLIENYSAAIKDNLENWDIHHKLELHPDGTIRFTKQSLIKLGLYYNRPPSELVWIRSLEHKLLHGKARRLNREI